MLNKLYSKRNKKGFTLVEVIVVLVILAIMAAILIPTLTGYIDKARERTIAAEARSLFIATQTILSEKYGTTGVAGSGCTLNATNYATPTNYEKEIADLSEVDFGTGSTNVATIAWSGAKVGTFTFTDGTYTATRNATTGAWTITKN